MCFSHMQVVKVGVFITQLKWGHGVQRVSPRIINNFMEGRNGTSH